MLKNFKKIKNIGRFYDVSIENKGTCAATFKKFNLIYADNGTGKSTITTILKSLWENDPQRLIEKQTINATGESFIELNVDNKTYKFENNKWNDTPDINFKVFDEEFVEKNIFVLSKIEPANRHKLFKHILFGEETVDKVKEIETLDKKLKGELKNKIDTAESTLKRKANIEDLDNTTEMNADALKTLKAQVKQDDINIEDAKIIRESLALDKISNFDSILYEESISKNLSTLSLAAEHKAHIKIHNAWLKDGVDIVQNENRKSCPFCLQSLENTGAFKIYKTVFSEEYSALRKEVKEHLIAVQNIYNDTVIANMIRVVEQNNKSFTFWHKYNKEIPEFLPPNTPLEETVKAFKIALKNLLERKQHNLLEAIVPNPDEERGLEKEMQFRQAIVNYNTIIDTVNKKIQIVKNKSQNIQELISKNKNDHIKIVCNDVKYRNPETAELYKKLKKYQQEKTTAEERIKILRAEINQESLIILEKYQDSINRELKKFGVNFLIEGVKRKADSARNEGVYFNILLKDKSFGPNGSTKHPYKLSNTLSSGDKSTLAFAFFIAKYRKKDISKQILVFDDPITSLDFFRKTRTQHTIRNFTNKAAQVIVLTHSIEFAKLFRLIRAKDSHFVEIIQNSSESGLSYTPYNKFSEMSGNRYIRERNLIMKYIESPDSVKRIDVMVSIRSYVETTLKRHYPSFASLTLGGMIKAFKDNENTCEDYIQDLEVINDGIKSENHGNDDIAQTDHGDIPNNELQHICNLALDISTPPEN